MPPQDLFIYGRSQPAIIENVKFIKDEQGNDTEIFSGFVSVRLMSTNDRIEWVRWSNALMSDSGYGIVTVPCEKDCVTIAFGMRNEAYVTGKYLFNQLVKSNLDINAFYGDEKTDVRLKVKKGELLVRGKSKSSIHFKNDGTTVFKLNDEKEETDSENLVIKIDAQRNITILQGNKISVTCVDATLTASGNTEVTAKTASLKADTVNVESNDIHLGKSGSEAPVIRSIDKVMHIDPVLGVPVQSQRYITKSGSTKSR